MKYLAINPKKEIITAIEYDDKKEAILAAGIKQNVIHERIDTGTIIVYDGYKIFKDSSPLFILNGNMYAGSALMYGKDEGGSFKEILCAFNIIWLPTKEDAIRAIKNKLCKRPKICSYKPDGRPKVVWKWPENIENPRKILNPLIGDYLF
jgi:hypothetical protein